MLFFFAVERILLAVELNLLELHVVNVVYGIGLFRPLAGAWTLGLALGVESSVSGSADFRSRFKVEHLGSTKFTKSCDINTI